MLTVGMVGIIKKYLSVDQEPSGPTEKRRDEEKKRP